MNFLYNRGGRGLGASDSHAPLQLGRTRVKLRPRRLRGGTTTGVEPEPAERSTRTHIFLDRLVGGRGSAAAGAGAGQGIEPRRRSGLVSWFRGRSSSSSSSRRPPPEDPVRPPPPPPRPPSPEPQEEELQSLDQLTQDCFLVPHHLVDRFLPTGHKLPSSPPVRGQRLRMRETAEPALSVVIHVQSHLQPVAPSPLDPVSPLHVQLTACLALLHHVAGEGRTRDAMLLSNLERTEMFPFLLYYTVQDRGGLAQQALADVRRGLQRTFGPLQATHVAQHTVHLYQEVATIARPPLNDQRRPSGDRTGYIVSVFRVMEGDDRLSFERDWPSWTGARQLYRTIPRRAGLRRMVLHKSCGDSGDIYYVLCCECSHLLDDVVSTVRTLPALRARLVGHTGVYKPMAVT